MSTRAAVVRELRGKLCRDLMVVDPAAVTGKTLLLTGLLVPVEVCSMQPHHEHAHCIVLDLLVITLTGVCADVRSIVARRVNDLSPYGPSVLAAQGVGMSPEEFSEGLADGRVAGHYGFAESIHLIAAALYA